MRHVHVMDIRPDVITRTGVIQPYSVQEIPPLMVARHSIQAFEGGPRANTQMQPEALAARAKRLATAMAAGKRLPPGTSPDLVKAARAMMEGKAFTIKSAGRTAYIKASPQTPSYAKPDLGRAYPVRSVHSYWNIYHG